MKFGDVYTNGINYWMVISPEKPRCDCCGHKSSSGGSMIALVVKDGEAQYFVGYPKIMTPADIKPVAHYVGRMTITND